MSEVQRSDRRQAHLGTRPGLMIAVVGLAALAAVTAFLWAGSTSDVVGLPAATETDEVEDPDSDAESDVGDASDDELEVVEDLPVVTYEVYLARDPFEPVREVEATDGGATDQNGGSGDDGSNGTTDDPDSPDDPSAPDPDAPDDPDAGDGPSEDPSCAGGEDERVCDGRVVSLLEVTERNGELVAEVQVDTTIYTVRKDQVFATQFELESFEGTECVMLTFGSETFRLCVGESALK